MTLGLLLMLGALDAPLADAGTQVPEVADAGVEPPSLVVAPPAPIAPPPEPANLAVWVQPLGTAAYGAGSAIFKGQTQSSPILVYLPLGASVILPHRLELAIELTFTLQLPSQQFGFGATTPRLGLWTAVGPLIRFGEQPLNGFFVEPKVVGSYAFNFGDQNVNQNVDHWLVGAGFDVGYQFTFRHLYIATVLGVALGGGNYTDWEIVTPWQVGFQQQLPNVVTPVILFNMNLLRIGGWR